MMKRSKRERPEVCSSSPPVVDGDALLDLNASMATSGFHVVRSLVVPPPSASLVDALKGNARRRRKTDVIFNGGKIPAAGDYPSACGDCKRKQLFFREVEWPVTEMRALIELVERRTASIVPQRWARDHVFLLSEAGCEEQPAHADYDPDVKPPSDDGVAGGYPMGCLVALEGGTRLVIWAPEAPTPSTEVSYVRQVVTLEPGDALLFRSDTIHAGAAYDASNLRVHCFLDRVGDMEERLENGTYDMTERVNKKL